ncbi:Asp-tRNA(Asn)/Glu-tRNA(Gln) amidotransferase subunit GatB [Candidatus Dojkabacteria bacterium]|nr:Asp-tRNA(Asn)/Glu-tRNA(Gln) amidotransferase subunit GatB [Candidatus Dojkabacteria bacterium]
MDKKYEAVIGLEIHMELSTKSKMFCGCSANHFEKEPNSQVCPVCLGLPGAMPSPNNKAIEYVIMLAQALNCNISQSIKFDRKHYFYLDLPKGYQISQYDEPVGLGSGEGVDFGGKQTVRIRRVHAEEDTATLKRIGDETLINFNRSGVPLVEIVTEPDFSESDTVIEFLKELQLIARYLGISDADMEKGSMRLEPNVSVRLATRNQASNSQQLPNYKVELKNINSFRYAKAAIDYEIQRQIKALETGEALHQETRGYNKKKKETYVLRSKESAADYRYFPEPDIPRILLDKDPGANNQQPRTSDPLPDLPNAKRFKLMDKYKLNKKQADYFVYNFVTNPELYNYFVELCDKNPDADSVVIAKAMLNKKINPGMDHQKAIGMLNTQVETDETALNSAVSEVISENANIVAQIKAGKDSAIMFLVGKVMQKLKGKADGKVVISRIRETVIG